MSRQQGYYSLVQFCPDPARAEVANLGVLLFSPEHQFLEVAMSKTVKRVKTVFPQLGYDNQQIKSMMRWVEERLDVERSRFRTKDDLSRFVGTRFNDVRLTPPRSIVVERPEEQLQALLAELVAIPKKQESVKDGQQTPCFPEVEAFFNRPELSRFVDFDRDLVLPVSGQTIHIPYVFTNGSVSLVKPERISQFDAAKRHLADGMLLSQFPTPDQKKRELIILADIDKQKLRDQIGQLSSEVADWGVRFYVEPKPMLELLEARAAGH